MADVVGIAWQTTAGSAYPDYRDLHVLQGQKSRRLDNLLRIFLSDSTSFLANDTSKFAAANITSVQFVPVFPFVLTTHGAAVDPNTGVVSTGTPSGTAFPRNFSTTLQSYVDPAAVAGAQQRRTLTVLSGGAA
jgi:hypothetical protein